MCPLKGGLQVGFCGGILPACQWRALVSSSGEWGTGHYPGGEGRLFPSPHTEVVPSRGQGLFPRPITVLLCVLLSFRERALGSSFHCWMTLVIGNLV